MTHNNQQGETPMAGGTSEADQRSMAGDAGTGPTAPRRAPLSTEQPGPDVRIPDVPPDAFRPRFGEFGLGRRPALDRRDARYSMARLATGPLATRVATKHWRVGTEVLDQGSTPQCVAYSWGAMLTSSPVRHRLRALAEAAGLTVTQWLDTVYRQAQRVDEWEGEGYEGTSVRAGAKVLQSHGLIAGYVWANDAHAARDYVLTRGPVVFGVNWYADMFDADPAGERPLHVAGSLAGGHALLAVGFSRHRDAFRLLNSWGPSWGKDGRAWLTFSDAQQLVRDEYGEACSAVETPLPPAR